MYCSITEAWNQENTMANLAKRFNREYFSNNNNQKEHFQINNNNVQKDDLYVDSKYSTVPEEKLDSDYANNKNMVLQHSVTKNIPNRKSIETNVNSCSKLVNKVLSCSKCRNMIRQRLSINNSLIPNSVNDLFKGNNKEIIILILIGLIIIILLDLFLRVGNSVN